MSQTRFGAGGDLEVISFSLEVNIENADRELRKFLTVAYRLASIVQRLSGSEDLDNLMRIFMEATMIANRLRLALYALQAARMAGGDPIAWALAGVAVAEVGVGVAGDMELRRPLE